MKSSSAESRSQDPVAPTRDAAVVVSEFDSSDADVWAEFVSRSDEATLFHTLAWRDVLRSTFRHEDRYLIARRGACVTGILPLVIVRSMIFGTTIVSVPFGVYGGLIADDQESGAALMDRAAELGRTSKADYVEFRQLHGANASLPTIDIYHTFIADVPATKEECLSRIPRKARAEVRKAMKNEDLEFGEEDIELHEFHHLFSLNKRRLGSPLFPSSLFWHLRRQFGEKCVIHTVRHQGEVVAAVMSFIFKGTLMPYYSGSVEGADASLRASNFMYFRLMEWAVDQGLERFDFGRSREGTGAFRFKKNQGFTPRRLSYQYQLIKAKDVPHLTPSNPKYRAAQWMFRRLPLFAAQKLGSWLVKRAPF